MEPKTGRRIVSKREYVSVLSKKMGWYFGSFMMLMFIPFFVLDTISHVSLSIGSRVALLTPVVLGFGPLSFCFARHAYKIAQQVAPGVPLTRANTADLPAPDSLVRASQAPIQAQKAVLLRPATQESQTPLEPLVRAAGAAVEL